MNSKLLGLAQDLIEGACYLDVFEQSGLTKQEKRDLREILEAEGYYDGE